MNTRNIISIALALLWAVSTAAPPVMIGHRGSAYGVENTLPAFANGVDSLRGAGLECDVRVTLDKQYVISHDETTERVGGSLTVAEATLEQLQAEVYVQSRHGETYLGHLCTVAAYLDLCVERGVFPVIELKWSTGINNNDMSNFDGLARLVIERGLTHQAIFLTSMKQSLEYIRTHYPQFTCQWLCRNAWRDNVEWCRQWNLTPSIAHDCIDDTTVDTFHNIGLKVATWTVDRESDLERLTALGVDYLTTNRLIAPATTRVK